MKMLALLLILAGCSSWSPVNRSDYTLFKQSDFLISNIYVNPNDIDVNKKTIQFDYNLIIKNLKPTPRSLNFKDASITIGLREISIPCQTLEKNETFYNLGPHETVTIICKIVLNKQEGMFQVGDYKSLIQIPLHDTVAKFAYLLRAEDFK